jgi:hypothetical protein
MSRPFGYDTLPDNPVWIDFTRLDGNPRFWPTTTEPAIDEAGEVNWMRIVPLDKIGRSISWRRKIAMELAPRMGLPCTFLRQLPILLANIRRSILRAQGLAQGIRDVPPSQEHQAS